MKNIDQIKQDADILVSTEMEELVGGVNTEMAIDDMCADCCAVNNGGIQTPIEVLGE